MIGLSATLFVLISSDGAQPLAQAPPDALIARLAREDESLGSVEALAAIRARGCSVVPDLARTLHVTRTETLYQYEQKDHPDDMRLVWTIAALRYVTGRDFTAPMDRLPTGVNRRLWLTVFLKPGQSRFFGSWMSRLSVHFATPAVQAAIIRKWRTEGLHACLANKLWRPTDSDFWFFGTTPEGVRRWPMKSVRASADYDDSDPKK
jgi:hypothetical protein